MPGGKTKITKRKTKPTKKTTPATDLKELKKMVRSEEALMKTELNYFKGLSISITVLIVCVFFAFGSLFTAMYLETKAMNAILITYFANNNEDVFVSGSVVSGGSDVDELVEATAEWLSFSKYGVDVSFPNSWTYLDKPYQQELHFYADGIIRLPGNGDMGDMYVQVLDKESTDDVMASDRVISKSQGFMIGDNVAEMVLYQGDDRVSEFVLIFTADPEINYRVMFDTQKALDYMDDVLQRIKIK